MKNPRFPKFKVTADFLSFLHFFFFSRFCFVHLKALNSSIKKKNILYAKRGNFAVEQMMSEMIFFLKLISYRKVNFQNISLFR